MKAVKIHNDETVINESRLAQLLEKERAHDAYVWATKRMADKARLTASQANESPNAIRTTFAVGYQQALTDFAQLVVDAPVTENKPT